MNRLVPFTILMLTTTATLTAQVPDGWHVASQFRLVNYTAGGGLTVFHPHRSDPFWSVTGLPSDLTGAGVSTPTIYYGANSVLVRPSDGRVIVGEVTDILTDTLEIHELTLTGQAVTGLVRHRVGTASPTQLAASVNQMAWLPGGRVLFVHNEATGPALGNSNLAILDLATSTVTAVPVTGVNPPGRWNAMAVDPSGTNAYIAVNEQVTSTLRNLFVYSVPVPAGGVASLVATMPGDNALQLTFDNNGDLLVGTGSSGSRRGIYRLVGSNWLRVSPTLSVPVNGLAVDRVTGTYLVRADFTNPQMQSFQGIERIGPNGNRTRVHVLPWGSGKVSGIDVMPSMAPYGTEMTNAYRWSVTPNPGGAPLVGNAGFSLTVTASGPQMPGLMAVGLQPGNRQVFGFQLLVNNIVFTTLFAPSATHATPLPIPATMSLAGVRLYAQTVYLDAGPTLVSSKGLRFTIY